MLAGKLEEKSEQSSEEIVKKIESNSTDGLVLIKEQISKLTKSLTGDIQKLVNIANGYRNKIERLKTEYKEANKEVRKLRGEQKGLEKKKKEVEDKAKNVTEREADLLTLHKVLENKKKSLDTREVALEVAERRKRG
jgi:uncharacterized coiled-coil DUF342 family protein